jgi:hypothetical protein
LTVFAVFRTTVRADETTDIEAVVGDLRAECQRAGMIAPLVSLIEAQTREILAPLIERGRQLAGQGSQINVTRDLTGDGYAVRVVFGAGLRRSFWDKLIGAFGGR